MSFDDVDWKEEQRRERRIRAEEEEKQRAKDERELRKLLELGKPGGLGPLSFNIAMARTPGNHDIDRFKQWYDGDYDLGRGTLFTQGADGKWNEVGKTDHFRISMQQGLQAGRIDLCASPGCTIDIVSGRACVIQGTVVDSDKATGMIEIQVTSTHMDAGNMHKMPTPTCNYLVSAYDATPGNSHQHNIEFGAADLTIASPRPHAQVWRSTVAHVRLTAVQASARRSGFATGGYVQPKQITPDDLRAETATRDSVRGLVKDAVDKVVKQLTCPECKGTGFYEGFLKVEPCSQGCKPL